jgi:SWI2/SNF2 ATPase
MAEKPLHTQGSGKSLEMVFYAAKIMRDPRMNNPTLVFITDRNDLDDQLFGEVFAPAKMARQWNGSPVIFEYERSVNENVINQGLFYLDWLLDHRAEFELLVMKKPADSRPAGWRALQRAACYIALGRLPPVRYRSLSARQSPA